MNRKVAVCIAVLIAAIAGGYLVVRKAHSRPSIIATLRVTVTPSEQLDFVAGRANSAMFKYVIGKEARLTPALARNLEIKAMPNSSLIDAKVAVRTRDEGQRFSETFVAALQSLCGNQAQLTLAEQSVR